MFIYICIETNQFDGEYIKKFLSSTGIFSMNLLSQ